MTLSSVILTSGLMLVVCACSPSPPPVTDDPASKKGTSIANPASVNCVKLGGTLESRTGEKGEYALCHLPSGDVCEEWSLIRGACP